MAMRIVAPLLAVAVLLVGVNPALADPDDSKIWHPSNFALLGIGGDYWWNYDSNSTTYDPNTDYGNASVHADWPLTQFWWHNGSTFAKAYLCDSSHTSTNYCGGGGNGHHLRFADPTPWAWTSNSGAKNGNPCNDWDIHYVPYAGQHSFNTAFFNVYYGYWSPVSTHFDFNDGNECSGNTEFGYSDLAERIVEDAERQVGWTPQADQNWSNYEAPRYEYHIHSDGHYEFHTWSNVYGTVPVYVP